jgi:DNA-binding response OmpR family regulator
MTVKAGTRLLIVDDEQDLVQLMKERFEAEGYDVVAYPDALPALHYVKSCGLPHLALIDLELPSMHGFELSDKLKALGDVPIMFITGNKEAATATIGLLNYAEDYIRKPFHISELAARVRRVLSRFPDFFYAQTPVIRVDDWLSVDFGQRRLLIEGRAEALTPIEANLLHILMRNAGRVISSEMLIARVWPSEDVYEDTLRVHMHRLRRKIEPDFRRPRYIHTERGMGYRFGMGDEAGNNQLNAAFSWQHP